MRTTTVPGERGQIMKRIFSKMNAVDILIAALLILGAATVISRMISPNGGSAATYSISALCEACPISVAKNIEPGLTVYDYETKAVLGKITSVQEISASESAANIFVTLSVNAKMRSYGLVSGDSVILIGRYMNLISANCVFGARIENIKKE